MADTEGMTYIASKGEFVANLSNSPYEIPSNVLFSLLSIWQLCEDCVMFDFMFFDKVACEWLRVVEEFLCLLRVEMSDGAFLTAFIIILIIFSNFEEKFQIIKEYFQNSN